MSGRVAKLMKPPRYDCSNLYGVEDCTSRKQAEAKSIINHRKWRTAGRWRQLSFATFGYPAEKPIPFICPESLMRVLKIKTLTTELLALNPPHKFILNSPKPP